MILLSNIVNDNLIQMLIAEAPGDGYLAYQKLKNYCWHEPDDLAMSVLQQEWQRTRASRTWVSTPTPFPT